MQLIAFCSNRRLLEGSFVSTKVEPTLTERNVRCNLLSHHPISCRQALNRLIDPAELNFCMSIFRADFSAAFPAELNCHNRNSAREDDNFSLVNRSTPKVVRPTTNLVFLFSMRRFIIVLAAIVATSSLALSTNSTARTDSNSSLGGQTSFGLNSAWNSMTDWFQSLRQGGSKKATTPEKYDKKSGYDSPKYDDDTRSPSDYSPARHQESRPVPVYQAPPVNQPAYQAPMPAPAPVYPMYQSGPQNSVIYRAQIVD